MSIGRLAGGAEDLCQKKSVQSVTVARFNFIAIMATIGMTVQHMQQRLYRSQKDKIIGGICGGLGDYFDVDPVFFRVLFVVLTFVNGIGLLLYIILWFVVPLGRGETSSENKVAVHTHEPAGGSSKSASSNVFTTVGEVLKKRSAGGIVIALIVILIGTVALLSNFFSADLLRFEIIWPMFLIFIGLYFIFKKE